MRSPVRLLIIGIMAFLIGGGSIILMFGFALQWLGVKPSTGWGMIAMGLAVGGVAWFIHSRGPGRYAVSGVNAEGKEVAEIVEAANPVNAKLMAERRGIGVTKVRKM